MGNAVEARWREFRGHETTRVRTRSGRCVPCEYEISARPVGEDRLAALVREWLSTYPGAARAFCRQDAPLVRGSASADLCDWMEGNPNGFGKSRIAGSADELGCPLPDRVTGRLSDLNEFLTVARSIADEVPE